ncbi:MAG: major capsid protein [Oceanococcaceae bacterium]
MPMVNPFNVFSVSEISAAIQKIPNSFGRLQELNLFPVRGTVSPKIAIEEWNGTLSLIPFEGSRRGPGQVGAVGKRKLRTFTVPKLVYDEFCGPEEVQGIRNFGGNEQDNLARLLGEKLTTARAKHDITLEHLRMGALKGQILDADGTVYEDLYKAFGVNAKSVDFLLGTPGTNIKAKCHEVLRHIEDRLLGERMTRAHVLVDSTFMDRFTDHAKVREAFAGYQEANQRLGGDMRNGFTFGGLTFEEYRGVSTDPEGNTRRFIAAGEGHAFPLGTANTFATYVAPADFNESVGQMGQVYYAKTMPAKFDRGWDIHTQSNVLPMCHRPEVLVRLHTSN